MLTLTNYAYFDSLGLTDYQIKELLKTAFTDEITKGYNAYKKDSKKKWQMLAGGTKKAILNLRNKK